MNLHLIQKTKCGINYQKVVFSVASILLLTFMIGTVSGEVHYINSTVLNDVNPCYVIVEPGVYLIDEDIELAIVDPTAENFISIKIETSDVILDGQSHSIRTSDSTAGYPAVYAGTDPNIYETPYSGDMLQNITVQRITTLGWRSGIYLRNIDQANVLNNIIDGSGDFTYEGIYLTDLTNSRVEYNQIFCGSQTNAIQYGESLEGYGNNSISHNTIFNAPSDVDQITLESPNGCQIINNTIDGGWQGIFIIEGKDTLIGENHLSFSNAAAISVDNGQNSTIIENNEITNCVEGITLSYAILSPPCVIIRKNTVMSDSSGSSGILINGYDYDDLIEIIIDKNQISGLFEGITIWGGGAAVQITGNIVTDCSSIGIQSDSDGGKIFDNIVTGCGDGITLNNNGSSKEIVNNTASYNQNGLLLQSSFSIIRSNSIEENSQYGIILDGEENLIYNNYLNNNENIFIEGSPLSYWNAPETLTEQNIVRGPSIGGNYWGTPDGSGFSDIALDEDNDGFADDPYEIDALNIDYYPLVHQASPPEYGVYYLNSTVLNSETTRYIIDKPGTYIFDEDIIDLEFPCDTSGTFSNGLPLILVHSSDVIIEGNGYFLDAIDRFNGIYNNDVCAVIIGDSEDDSGSVTYENVTVRNLSLSDWGTGIETYNKLEGTIENNILENCGMGIEIGCQLWTESNLVIRNNRIISDGSCSEGIRFGAEGGGIIVENNYISNMEGYGIYNEYGGPNNQVIGNIVTNCGATGIQMESSEGKISNNIVTLCSCGINAFANDMEILNNTVSDNQVGLYLNCAFSTIRNNIIEGNSQYGVVMNAYEDSVFFNNYLNNSENTYYEESYQTSYWNISEPLLEKNIIGGPSIGGNFWGTPDGNGYSQTAIDQDMDGFADEPYVIVSGYCDMNGDGTPEYYESTDYFPLVNFAQIPENQLPLAFFSFDYPDSSNNDIPTPDDVITFFDNSWDPDDGDIITEWLWDFGDGETSIEQNPSHQYFQSGFYTVNLTVTDGNGAIGSYEEEILVNYLPIVDFTMDSEPPLVAGQIVHFTGTVTDQDGTISELSWRVFSGSQPYPEIVSTDLNMGYEFTTPDLYVITLTAIDDLGSPGIAGYILVVNELEETLYFLMAPGVEFDGTNVTFDSASMDEFIGNVFSIDEDTLTITMNGLTTTLVTDGFTDVNGLLQGEVDSITVENAPLIREVVDIGEVGASFKASLTPENSAYLEDVIIEVSINEAASTGVQTAYELAAVDASLDIVDIAYAFNIIGATLENGVDVIDATIVMTAPESWVVSQGGPDQVRIFRYSEYDGTTEILEPIYAFDEITGVYTFTAFSPNGLSVFSLVAVTEIIPDTTPPLISNILASPNPAAINTAVTLTATIDDTGTGNSNIGSVLYSTDGSTWTTMTASDGAFDEAVEDVVATLPAYSVADILGITIKATDIYGNTAISEPTLLAIYDPNGAFITAGGWFISPAGAYKADPAITGKANLGLNSKYKKGTSIPTGETEFHLKEADLKFKSTSYDWMVINGGKATYRGSGTVNGAGNYGFLVSAIAGEISGGEDLIRFKIWDKATNTVIYDNGAGSDSSNPITPLGGGNIKIHA